MKKIVGVDKEYDIDQNDCFWSILCRTKENVKKLNDDDIKNSRGVYVFWNWDDEPIRIGKAVKVRNRLISYATHPNNYEIFNEFQGEIAMVSVIYTKDEKDSAITELDLLECHKPKYNKINKNL